MPSTPTTKSQVQAYRFVLRRMQSALVRRDSVMLHDPMRSHGRATIVGFLLGMLGMVGFIVWGLISPSPGLPSAPGIVIGKTSGQIYVLTGDPATLTPTFNLASARLLLMARQQGGGNGQVAVSTVVPDDSLRDVPRGRRTGILDGPQLLPTKDQRISDNWAVCDNFNIDSRLPQNEQLASAPRTTTVYAGVSSLGQELTPDQAILAVADDGKYYLIYRLPSNPNDPSANETVRAELDPTDNAVSTAFRLNGPTPRKVSIGLINAIPPVPPLTAPTVPDNGGVSNFAALRDLGMTNGSVLQVDSATGRDDYVALPNGVQKISEPVAQLLLASDGDPQPHHGTLDTLRMIPQLQNNDPGTLPLNTMPQAVPTLLEPVQFPTACLGWSVVNGRPHTSVFVGKALPTPRDKNVVPIGEAGPSGQKIDNFYMPTGLGAVIQSATGPDSFGKGPISLVTDSGVRYGIPNVDTAKGLGIYDAPPAPAPKTIIELLPTGTSLNTTDAQRSYNDIDIPPGMSSFPTQTSSQAPGSGSSGSSGN